MIYFIRYGDTERVKIGFAKNVRKRLAALQVASPERLTVIATCEGTMAQEQMLHKALRGYGVGGEWFKMAPPVMVAIWAASNGEPPDRSILLVGRTKRKMERARQRASFRGHINALLFQLHSPWFAPESRRPVRQRLEKWGLGKHVDDSLIAWADRRDERRLRSVA